MGTLEVRSWLWRGWTPPERLLILATLATPLALIADERLHLSVWTVTLSFGSFLELGGAPIELVQQVGIHNLVWIGAAAASVALAPRRELLRAPFVCALAVIALVLVSTLVGPGGDRLTAAALLGSLVPLAAIVLIVGHPDVGRAALWACVAILVAATASVLAATIAHQLLRGALDHRLGLAFFGPGTDSGPVCAYLAILVLAAPWPLAIRGPVSATLIAGVVLSGTRGAILAAAAGLLVLALSRRSLRWPLIVVAVAGILIFSVTTSRSIFGFSDASNTLRRASVLQHWRLFLARPSLGYGISSGSILDVSQAQNTLLSVANAGGAYAAALFVAVFAIPALRRTRGVAFEIVGLAVLAAALVTWDTTGPEVLIQMPITNVLPIVLAGSLASAQALSLSTARFVGPRPLPESSRASPSPS